MYMSLVCFLYFVFFSLPLVYFYSFPPLPLSICCQGLGIMHLTNHWARKGINSYSKQRAIMGTLVLRKLSIFGPARRCAGITGQSTHCLQNTLLAKPERRGGRVRERGLFPRHMGKGRPLPLTASPQRPNHQMTWWSSLQWQTDNESVLDSSEHTTGLK